MPSTTDEAILLVARFLRSHNYDETLEALIREANLSSTAGIVNKGDLTIEKVLEEKRVFDVSLQFEKLGDDNASKQWRPAAPAVANPISGPTSSNILHLSFARVLDAAAASASASDTNEEGKKQFILSTTADRRLNILNLPTGTLHSSLTTLQDSPILSCAVLRNRFLLTSSMSGSIKLCDFNGNVLHQRRDHNKYVVQIAVCEKTMPTQDAETAIWVATAGWDGKVNLYRLSGDAGDSSPAPELGEPVATITLPTNPEALLFVEHPDNGQTILMVTRRDSTYLSYYSVDPEASLLGKQNIAPHANSWTHQTPSSLSLCPTDPTLVAIATSALPHMKLLLVRLLFPAVSSSTTTTTATGPAPTRTMPSSLLADPNAPEEQMPSSASRAALALQDREAAAILIHCTTMAPQTAYSTPALTWRPDGSGVWVNSDDGAIRGIEASTGKVVATLKGHDAGSKIRCLCSGWVESEGGNGEKEEWLVSGGFDQRLIIWKPERK